MSETRYYIVQSGDSLEGIAHRLGVSASLIQSQPENAFVKEREKKQQYPLWPGDRLAIPGKTGAKSLASDSHHTSSSAQQALDYLLFLVQLHPAVMLAQGISQLMTANAPKKKPSNTVSSHSQTSGKGTDPKAVLPIEGYSKKHPLISSSVILTKPIESAFLVLLPYLPKGVVMTSGYRSDADQERIINDYYTQNKGNPLVKDVEKRRQWLIAKPRELKIGRVGYSLHRTGLAFDLSGGSLDKIQAAVDTCVKEQGQKFPLLGTLIERKNNCLHINLRPVATVVAGNSSTKPVENNTSNTSNTSLPKTELKGITIPKTGNAFIDGVSADAVLSQRETGVPASVTLAQAILESGWGKSTLTSKYKNYFGIKGKSVGGTIVLSTGEHLDGKDVVIQDGFRVYSTPSESFADHGRFFIVNKRYSEAMKHTDDCERFAQEIHKAGYATDPDYSEKLIKIIRQYKLADFDRIARGQGSLNTGASTTTTTTTTSSSSSTVEAPSLAAVTAGKATLTTGMKGSAVNEVQLLLVQAGYLTKDQMATGPGNFGPKTLAALQDFQRSANVSSPKGIVDKATLEALRKAKPNTPAADQQKPVPDLKDPKSNANSNSSSVAVYDGKKPAPGMNKDAWVPLDAPVKGDPNRRSAETYTAVIKQFAVTVNPRYARTSASTFCNIFAWDVTKAMGTEIPHWVDKDNNPSGQSAKNHELNANATQVWLKDHGGRFGWKMLGQSDRPKDSQTEAKRPAVWKSAQELANKGFPVVVIWRNPGGIGHIGVIRPGTVNANGPALAQAGANNVDDGQVHDSTTFGNRVVEYWANETGKADPRLAAA